jgi:hypothetical protein
MKTPDKPWGIALHIYDKPLKTTDVVTVFEEPEGRLERINGYQVAMDEVIQAKVKKLGLEGKSLVDLDRGFRENVLGGEVRNDPNWRDSCRRLLELLAPGLPFNDEVVNTILRPDFNSSQIDFRNCSYSDDKLRVNLGSSHSYGDFITSVKDADGNTRFPQLKINQVSVIGVITTKDGYLVPADRGGHNFRLTRMGTPAGTAEPHSGRNPLFESYDKEGDEELGLTPQELYGTQESGLVAITKDLALGPRIYAVFRSRLDLKFSELETRWKEKARDRFEHNTLINIPDDGDEFIYLLNRRVFDFDCADPKRLSVTQPRNYDAYLPQMNISFLASYAQTNGVKWAKSAEELAHGFYSLVPGFNCLPIEVKK